MLLLVICLLAVEAMALTILLTDISQVDIRAQQSFFTVQHSI
jgi:hypothetical protein